MNIKLVNQSQRLAKFAVTVSVYPALSESYEYRLTEAQNDRLQHVSSDDEFLLQSSAITPNNR